jgi:hypothetical protein
MHTSLGAGVSRVAERIVFALKSRSAADVRRFNAAVMAPSSRTMPVQMALLSSVRARECGAIIALGDE